MKFAIQQNLISDKNFKAIVEATEDLPREFIEVIPFTDIILPEEINETKNWIPYGSTLLINLAHAQNWKGCYFDLEQFNYKSACENRSDMLNDGFIMPIKEAIQFFKMQHPQSMWFVRPSADLKQFTGEVNNATNLYEWFEDAMLCASSGSYQLPETTDIVISVPREIGSEYRFFIVGGKVISGSMYRINDRLKHERITDPEFLEEAQTLADIWLPHPCCTMDLAMVKEGIKVIEFNCINASGFYNHDVKAIMTELYNYSCQ